MTHEEAFKLRIRIIQESPELFAVNTVMDHTRGEIGKRSWRVDATEKDTGIVFRFNTEFDYERFKIDNEEAIKLRIRIIQESPKEEK